MYALSHRDEAELKAEEKRLLARPGEGGRGKIWETDEEEKQEKGLGREDEKDEALLQELLSCKHF